MRHQASGRFGEHTSHHHHHHHTRQDSPTPVQIHPQILIHPSLPPKTATNTHPPLACLRRGRLARPRLHATLQTGPQLVEPVLPRHAQVDQEVPNIIRRGVGGTTSCQRVGRACSRVGERTGVGGWVDARRHAQSGEPALVSRALLVSVCHARVWSACARSPFPPPLPGPLGRFCECSPHGLAPFPRPPAAQDEAPVPAVAVPLVRRGELCVGRSVGRGVKKPCVI